MELNDQSGYLFRPLSALYDGILRILRLFVWKNLVRTGRLLKRTQAAQELK